jgi:beta-galactosidase
VEDKDGLVVPQANNLIHFQASGPGEIVATDNGDATDLTSFPSPDRKAFHGLALAIVRGTQTGGITIQASSPGLKKAWIEIKAR